MPTLEQHLFRIGNVRAVHRAEDRHHLCLRLRVALPFDAHGFTASDGSEENMRTGEEVGQVERLPDGVVSSRVRVGIDLILCRGPERCVEAEEDFGVDGLRDINHLQTCAALITRPAMSIPSIASCFHAGHGGENLTSSC